MVRKLGEDTSELRIREAMMDQAHNEATPSPSQRTWADLPYSHPFSTSLQPGSGVKNAALIALVPVAVLSVFVELRLGRHYPEAAWFLYLAGFAGAVSYFIVLPVYRRLRQHQQLRMNASLALERPDEFVLYLRSFRRSGQIVVPNHLESVVARRLMGNFWDVELGISYSVAEKLPTIAIGATRSGFGAAKLTSSDQSWQALFLQLAAQAKAIFIVPDDRPGTMWELRQVLASPDLRRKTIVLMMPEQRGWRSFGSRIPRISASWERVRTQLGAEFPIPPYHPDGAFLRLDEAGRYFTESGFANFHPRRIREMTATAYFQSRTVSQDERMIPEYDEGLTSIFDPIWPIAIMCIIIAIGIVSPEAGGTEVVLVATCFGTVASLVSASSAFTLTRERVGRFKEWWVAATWFRLRRAPGLIRHLTNFLTLTTFILVLRSFVVEPFKIPSSSMVPTLLVGDFIFVNKYAYGIRLPIINRKVIEVGNPQRGHVMVFKYPKDMSQDYIKRVIGVPGDTITYENKRLTVNGKPVHYTPMDDYLDDQYPVYHKQFTEHLTDVPHRILNSDDKRALDLDAVEDFPNREACDYSYDKFTCIVPPGRYFTMGDSRDNSADSRYWGFVPHENIVGKAVFVWMNFSSKERIGPVL